MSAARLISYLHLAYLAKPIADRAIYRTIRKIHAKNIVVIGLGDGQLARKMVLFAQQQGDPTAPVRFTGIDPFELRSPGSDHLGVQNHLTLKQAHRMFRALGARVQLVPGDPFAALARTANSLLATDLLIIRADQQGASLEQAWFYLPRMLHESSVVLVEQLGSDGLVDHYDVLDPVAVRQRVDSAPRRRRAA